MIQNKSLTPVKVQLLPPSTKHKCDHKKRKPSSINILSSSQIAKKQKCTGNTTISTRSKETIMGDDRNHDNSSCCESGNTVENGNIMDLPNPLPVSSQSYVHRFLYEMSENDGTVVSTIPNESVCTLGSIKRLKPGVDKNGILRQWKSRRNDI